MTEKRSGTEKVVSGIVNVLGFVFLLASLFLALLSPYMGGGVLSTISLISPVVVIVIWFGLRTSSRNRPSAPSQPSAGRIDNYFLRLLILFGIFLLGLVLLFAIFVMISTVADSSTWAANLWGNLFSLGIVLALIGLGIFGLVKLVQLLRR